MRTIAAVALAVLVTMAGTESFSLLGGNKAGLSGGSSGGLLGGSSGGLLGGLLGGSAAGHSAHSSIHFGGSSSATKTHQASSGLLGGLVQSVGLLVKGLLDTISGLLKSLENLTKLAQPIHKVYNIPAANQIQKIETNPITFKPHSSINQKLNNSNNTITIFFTETISAFETVSADMSQVTDNLSQLQTLTLQCSNQVINQAETTSTSFIQLQQTFDMMFSQIFLVWQSFWSVVQSAGGNLKVSLVVFSAQLKTVQFYVTWLSSVSTMTKEWPQPIENYFEVLLSWIETTSGVLENTITKVTEEMNQCPDAKQCPGVVSALTESAKNQIAVFPKEFTGPVGGPGPIRKPGFSFGQHSGSTQGSQPSGTGHVSGPGPVRKPGLSFGQHSGSKSPSTQGVNGQYTIGTGTAPNVQPTINGDSPTQGADQTKPNVVTGSTQNHPQGITGVGQPQGNRPNGFNGHYTIGTVSRPNVQTTYTFNGSKQIQGVPSVGLSQGTQSSGLNVQHTIGTGSAPNVQTINGGDQTQSTDQTKPSVVTGSSQTQTQEISGDGLSPGTQPSTNGQNTSGTVSGPTVQTTVNGVDTGSEQSQGTSGSNPSQGTQSAETNQTFVTGTVQPQAIGTDQTIVTGTEQEYGSANITQGSLPTGTDQTVATGSVQPQGGTDSTQGIQSTETDQTLVAGTKQPQATGTEQTVLTGSEQESGSADITQGTLPTGTDQTFATGTVQPQGGTDSTQGIQSTETDQTLVAGTKQPQATGTEQTDLTGTELPQKSGSSDLTQGTQPTGTDQTDVTGTVQPQENRVADSTQGTQPIGADQTEPTDVIGTEQPQGTCGDDPTQGTDQTVVTGTEQPQGTCDNECTQPIEFDGQYTIVTGTDKTGQTTFNRVDQTQVNGPQTIDFTGSGMILVSDGVQSPLTNSNSGPTINIASGNTITFNIFRGSSNRAQKTLAFITAAAKGGKINQESLLHSIHKTSGSGINGVGSRPSGFNGQYTIGTVSRPNVQHSSGGFSTQGTQPSGEYEAILPYETSVDGQNIVTDQTNPTVVTGSQQTQPQGTAGVGQQQGTQKSGFNGQYSIGTVSRPNVHTTYTFNGSKQIQGVPSVGPSQVNEQSGFDGQYTIGTGSAQNTKTTYTFTGNGVNGQGDINSGSNQIKPIVVTGSQQTQSQGAAGVGQGTHSESHGFNGQYTIGTVSRPSVQTTYTFKGSQPIQGTGVNGPSDINSGTDQNKSIVVTGSQLTQSQGAAGVGQGTQSESQGFNGQYTIGTVSRPSVQTTYTFKGSQPIQGVAGVGSVQGSQSSAQYITGTGSSENVHTTLTGAGQTQGSAGVGTQQSGVSGSVSQGAGFTGQQYVTYDLPGSIQGTQTTFTGAGQAQGSAGFAAQQSGVSGVSQGAGYSGQQYVVYGLPGATQGTQGGRQIVFSEKQFVEA